MIRLFDDFFFPQSYKKFGICINEKMDKTFLEETEKQGRLVERMTIIMDLSGLSRKHLYAPGLMVFKKLSHIGEGFFFFFLLFYYFFITFLLLF